MTPAKTEKPTCPWNFDGAIDILAHQKRSKITTNKARDEARYRIEFICRLYEFDRAVELQETDAAKAAAFRLALQSHEPRQRVLAEIARATELRDIALYYDAFARLAGLPWIPAALEQEAVRLQGGQGLSVRESFEKLKVQYEDASRPGRIASRALVWAVQRLQVLATDYAPELAWKRRNVPQELTKFILEVLDVAKVKHPSIVENPTRFRRLLIPPARK